MSIGLRTRHTLDTLLADLEREESEQRPRHVPQRASLVSWLLGIVCVLGYCAVLALAEMVAR